MRRNEGIDALRMCSMLMVVGILESTKDIWWIRTKSMVKKKQCSSTKLSVS